MNPQEVLDHLRRRVPRFEPTAEPELLGGGYLNYVWRVRGHPEPVIVKHAPPYIAAKPDVDVGGRLGDALAPYLAKLGTSIISS